LRKRIKSKRTIELLKIISQEPLTSKEICDKLGSISPRNQTSFLLSKMFRKGYFVRSKYMVANLGFIYSLPKHETLIKDKILSLVPDNVRKAIALLNLGKTLSFEELHELGISYDDFDLWIKNTLNRWGFVEITKYKNIVLIHRKDVKPDFSDIDKKIFDLKFKTREQGIEFEHNVKERLKEIVRVLNEQGHKAEFINSVGNDKGQWIDGEIRVKLFNKFPDIRFLIEIKSYVAAVNQVLEFLHKIRHFDGFVFPLMIAYAFTGNVYKFFPSRIMLLREKDLNEIKKIIENLTVIKSLKF
jgi:hypothetical protein